MLIKVKKALRITSTAFDDEIEDLIEAVKSDLILSGVNVEKVNSETVDPLINRAITTYCKANFGYDNKDAERFQKSYDSLKMHLSLSIEYTTGGEDNV